MANKCLRCGGCCVVADISLGEVTKENRKEKLDLFKWLNYHRCDTQIMNYPDGRKKAILRIPTFCVKLSFDKKENNYFCKDYENRPQLCKDFKCMKQG